MADSDQRESSRGIGPVHFSSVTARELLHIIGHTCKSKLDACTKELPSTKAW